jgi:predicted DsbA family dithiol-disulfide isomerase
MPSVQKAHTNQKEYPAKDVVVMTVSLDGGDGAAVKQFLNDNQYTMPSAHDKGMAFGRKINVRGVPSTFIIDRNQSIVASGMGPLDLDRADVKKLIRSLLVLPRS